MARLGFRQASDERADPARLAAVGNAVRARLLADPRAVPRGGHRADLFTVPGFVSPQVCQALIGAIEKDSTQSTLYDDGGSNGVRTSSTHYFRNDALASRLAVAIDALLGLPRAHAETMQGQRYRPGEEYRHHFDYFRTERAHWQLERERGGQRHWTAMIYLNTPDAGGETDFRRLGLSIAPQPGLLVTWNNMDRKGRPNPAMIHAGMPVDAGVKYIITQWYRLDPWVAQAGKG